MSEDVSKNTNPIDDAPSAAVDGAMPSALSGNANDLPSMPKGNTSSSSDTALPSADAENQASAPDDAKLPSTADEAFLIRPQVVYHISEFDGPIDMLLELISAAKIRIEDIFVSEVTHQYVEIIKSTPKEELDYEYAGDFITMAAQLVYLKSIRTLPKDEDEEITPDDPEYEREEFIRKIKEYALMKEQADKLRLVETVNRFEREPVYTDKDYRVCLTDFSMSKLVEAFAHVLANSKQAELDAIPKKVVKDRFSVQDQMRNIRQLISLYGSFQFTFLFEPDYDREDIVTTFLAVLELMKYGKLRADQSVVFGDIMLYNVDDGDTDLSLEVSEDGEY